ncbi:myotubularin-related protein 9-like [Cryptotermes secundus]|uniref:myotubularin-related protein 9-like n=1 Tax=Cryptotermes secundus TaxID=105785 RepID=UPI000CD7C5CA|nr:myotubularin-related protein 9-like [Cryptotermes secundus]XP_023721236.1 myotubularin-related protein 9-like [Cryptotermes secundus]XP_023721237.1 myotubularin-related protein 9-like [Cryptotermes secundus]XP_023721238.1 myotubularin-related protein 9-like [Cryptotermes secundus]XP_023721240.1 myotubularin-related protein 9-like [Cryptotermes secundus]XP_023721241.1 myotubularin-related protein 9-like [Cryptotermes secundus]XP_033610368.1 myotubularin-related protein 9-like [Cryptotermes 
MGSQCIGHSKNQLMAHSASQVTISYCPLGKSVEELWLLHHNVDAVERRISGMQGGSLIIKCKDFRIIQLDISNPDKFLKVATTVENLSSLDEPTKLYPFFYRPMFPILEDGWT